MGQIGSNNWRFDYQCQYYTVEILFPFHNKEVLYTKT